MGVTGGLGVLDNAEVTTAEPACVVGDGQVRAAGRREAAHELMRSSSILVHVMRGWHWPASRLTMIGRGSDGVMKRHERAVHH